MRPPLRLDSLRGRLILGAVVWIALALAVGGAVLSGAFRDSVERSFHQRLEAHLRGLAAGVDIHPDGTAAVARPAGEPRFEQPYSGWYWQVSDGTGALARSRSLWDFALAVAAAESPGATHRHTEAGPRGETLMVVERDLAYPGRARPLHVAVAADRAEVAGEVRSFHVLLAASLGGLGLGLVVAVALQVGYGLRPLARLAGALQAVRAGGRIGDDYPSEIAPLAKALNSVLDHDARLIEGARTHVGNLAHALKTPLAVLKAELGAGRAADPAVMAAQVTRMNALVEQNLARARAEASSARAVGMRVAAAEVAAEVASVLRRAHAGRAVAIVLDCAADAVFVGDREDLAEMLGNLMDNACKWAAAQVLVTARAEGGGLVVAVEDDGPGLDPVQARLAGARGTRLDEATPGSGLGLSIVADRVALYGGRVEMGRAALGGLRAALHVPAPA